MEILNFILIIVILIIIISAKKSILREIENLGDIIRNLSFKINELDKKIQNQKTDQPLVEQEQKIIVEQQPVTEPELVIPEEIIPEPEIVESFITEEEQVEPEVVEEIVREEIIVPSVTQQDQPKPEKEKSDIEKWLGENLLSKIGIATLVLGIAYFVKYAIDQNWINEIGRVAIGILLGGAIIGIAHKLKDNYRTFSSILVGGGISVLYITITIAFREYNLFSQTVAFIFLIFITILSVLLSILYDRKELAIFSLLGGFASPLMVSSGTGNYIVLFSYIFILNAGMLVLSFKKQWKIVSIISYIFTQIFYWAWLIISFNEFTQGRIGALVFISLFYVQFYVLAIIEYFKHERKLSAFQSLIVLSNNLSMFAAAIYIFRNSTLDVKGLITIIMALLNAIPMIILFKQKAIDKNMLYMLIAIVLTFVSLAVPIQLEGCAITMFWAAETVILLFLWQKSEITIFKSGFIILQFLVLASLFMDWGNYYIRTLDNHIPIVFNKICITGLFVTATIIFNSWLFGKEKFDEFIDGVSIKSLQRIFTGIWIVLLFVTGLFELDYQINYYFSSDAFCKSILGLYFYLFLMILLWVRWKKESGLKALYYLSLTSLISYVTIYMYFVFEVRGEVMFGELPGWWYFNMHYFSIPAVLIILIFILKKKGEIFEEKTRQNWMYWLVAIISVIILSVEIDNILLMNFAEKYGQYTVLKNSHNIAYPILWGLFSFPFMFFGMKKKNRTLRIISLTLFSLIIIKLYAYDVWHMQPTGRILAFIFLGVILLVVSFMYQKLKKLL